MKKEKSAHKPGLVLPCIFGMAAYLCALAALWIWYVGGPRLDVMAKGNVALFCGLTALFSGLCAWRSVKYKKHK